MRKPNLNNIIKDSLDKTGHIPNPGLSKLPTNGWLDAYNMGGGIYLSDKAKATQFGQYKRGGGYFPEYHSWAPPRMDDGGDNPPTDPQKLKEFIVNWNNSPMGKEMLNASVDKDDPLGINILYAKDVRNKRNYLTQNTPISVLNKSDYSKLPNVDRSVGIAYPKYNTTPYTYGELVKSIIKTPSALITNLNPSVKRGMYHQNALPNRWQTWIYSQDFDNNKEGLDQTLIHELSHASDWAGTLIPQSDKNKMDLYAYGIGKWSPFRKKLNEWQQYIADPTETRARLMNFRYNAMNQGLYNPFKEKVTLEKLKNYKLSDNVGLDPLNQLRDVYTDKQIVELLNSVSKNKSNKVQTFAEYGGVFEEGGSLEKFYPGGSTGCPPGFYKHSLLGCIPIPDFEPVVKEQPQLKASNKPIVKDKNYGKKVDPYERIIAKETAAKQAERYKDLANRAALSGAAAATIVTGGMAAPYILPALEAPIAGVAGLTGSNILTTLGGYNLANNLASGTISNRFKNAKDWKDYAAATGETALDITGALPMASSIIKGAPSVMQDINQVGNYLTTQTPLRNTYKLNPWAWKPNPTSAYRMIGDEAGLTDAIESGFLKPSTKGSDIGKIHNETHFQIGAPSDKRKYYGELWDRGYPGPYMAEVSNAVSDPRFSPTNTFWGTGKEIGDNVITYPENYIPTNEANFYKKDWLRGYKEVPKPTNKITETLEDISKENGGEQLLTKYAPGGLTTNGCPPGFYPKPPYAGCFNDQGKTPEQVQKEQARKGTFNPITNPNGVKPIPTIDLGRSNNQTTQVADLSNNAVNYKVPSDGMTAGLDMYNKEIKRKELEKNDAAARAYMQKWGVDYATALKANQLNTKPYEKNAQLTQGYAETPDQKAYRIQRNQQYVNAHPNTAQLDANGNIIEKDPYYNIDGTLKPGAKNAVAQRGLKTASGIALGTGAVITGAGVLPEIAAAATPLAEGASALMNANIAGGITGNTLLNAYTGAHAIHNLPKVAQSYQNLWENPGQLKSWGHAGAQTLGTALALFPSYKMFKEASIPSEKIGHTIFDKSIEKGVEHGDASLFDTHNHNLENGLSIINNGIKPKTSEVQHKYGGDISIPNLNRKLYRLKNGGQSTGWLSKYVNK